MNMVFRLLTLWCVAFMTLQSREIGTPLTPLAVPPLRGFIHYPLHKRIGEDVQGQEQQPEQDGEHWWNLALFGGAYTRRAHQAYTDCHGTDTEPLASVFFGQPAFTLSQAFAGSIANVPRNPFVSISTIAPDLEYRERGAVFGLNAETLSSCGNYLVGFRARLPVRQITVRNNATAIAGDTINDVCLLNKESDLLNGNVESIPSYTFAYRLDFLAALRDDQGRLFLNFADPNESNQVTFAGINLTTANRSTNNGEIAGAKVNLLGRPANGGKPLPPFGLRDLQVNQLGALSPDGSGLMFPNRAVFGGSVNYGGLSTGITTTTTSSIPLINCNVAGNLANIFVAPTISLDGPANDPDTGLKVTEAAAQLNQTVQEYIRTLDASALDFLNQVGISFGTQHQEGVGDLNTEIYLGSYLDDNLTYGELQFGVKFPTGKKVRGSAAPLLLPLGNNGHTELRIGGLLDWQALDWMYLHLDSTYSWALKDCERIAAPFQGACVKNVGPCVDANISWSYYIGHINLTFAPPCYPYAGFSIAYEPYVKQHDKVRLPSEQVPDLLGNLQTLDSNVIENRTRVISQKVITEFFYAEDAYSLFGGWTHVFAGRNAPKETDFYIGFFFGF